MQKLKANLVRFCGATLNKGTAWIALSLYFLFLAFTSVFFVPPTWDEYLDFSGCVGAANHLFAALRGQSTDIATITHDLEWYGNAYRWPAYILWALVSGIPVKIPAGPYSYDQFLASSFSSSIHITAALYGCIAIYFYAKLLRRLVESTFLRLFSLFVLASSPFWLSNSFWNLKDLPIAFPVLGVLYLSTLKAKNSRNLRIYILLASALLGTILANKYAYAPLVAVSAALYSYSILWVPIVGCSKASLRSSLLSFLGLFFCVLSAALLVSILLTPQVVGNPLYPLESTRYFASHPLISYNHSLSIEFLVSRASYLLSPSLLLLLTLGSLRGISLIFWKKQNDEHLHPWFSRERALLHVYSWLITSIYLIPVIATGRTFYGPDLRHLIWLYPLILLSLTVASDGFLQTCSSRARKLLIVALSFSFLVGFLEVLAIYPHYYSYRGVLPFSPEEQGSDRPLILSKYNPYAAPEMQAQMFMECSLDHECAGHLNVSGRLQKSSVSGFTYPMNPSYVSAYVRLGKNANSFPLYRFLGYRFFVDENDKTSSCIRANYVRHRIFYSSSIAICK